MSNLTQDTNIKNRNATVQTRRSTVATSRSTSIGIGLNSKHGKFTMKSYCDNARRSTRYWSTNIALYECGWNENSLARDLERNLKLFPGMVDQNHIQALKH